MHADSSRGRVFGRHRADVLDDIPVAVTLAAAVNAGGRDVAIRQLSSAATTNCHRARAVTDIGARRREGARSPDLQGKREELQHTTLTKDARAAESSCALASMTSTRADESTRSCKRAPRRRKRLAVRNGRPLPTTRRP